MYYVEVEPGVRLFVHDINPSGRKTIVFIHGWPLNNKMFEYQYNVLPFYGYRCIGIDLRGFGKSDQPWTGYSYDRLAEDVHKVIEKLNLHDIILVGFSMGGPIVIKYMSKYNNDRVSKLVLLAAAAPSFTQHPGYPYGMTKEQIDELLVQTYHDRPQMLTDFGKLFFGSNPSDSFEEWFHNLNLENSSYATIKTLESLRDENVENDVPNIKVPTGIFYGVKDRVCDPQFAQILHQQIKGSELYKFDYSGHAVFYDELDKFTATLLQFLNK